jgi:hypothetical protein
MTGGVTLPESHATFGLSFFESAADMTGSKAGYLVAFRDPDT